MLRMEGGETDEVTLLRLPSWEGLGVGFFKQTDDVVIKIDVSRNWN